MEKKLNRIQRWLDRCVIACKAGAWGSALMEAECLEAELKSAREEIWAMAVADPKPQFPSLGTVLRRFLRVSTASLALLFALVLPLSSDSEKRYGSVAGSIAEGRFAWVTLDEGQLLDSLRRDLSENNRGRVAEVPAIVPTRPAVQVSAGAKEASLPIAKEARRKSDTTGEGNNKEAIPADRVLSLIQAGQRAIRVGEPAVRVMP